jgi:integrase
LGAHIPAHSNSSLKSHKAESVHVGAADPVFVTRGYNGGRHRQTADTVGRRLKTAISRANVKLNKLGIEPISDRVTPHSLRRTYASLRAALRDDPVCIAEQLGHEDPRFTFRGYQRGEAPGSAHRRVPRRVRSGARMGTNGHWRRFCVATCDPIAAGARCGIRSRKP